MFDSVQPHRQQPTRLPGPWDSPGKNTGVGCHFLLQCRKVKSESEVAGSCLTLSDPTDCSLPTRLLRPWDFPGKSTGVLDWATSHLREFYMLLRASQVALVVKNLPADADVISVPGSGRSPGGAHGNPLQYSCLENLMNRGASWATVHRVTKSHTRLKRLTTYTHVLLIFYTCNIKYCS